MGGAVVPVLLKVSHRIQKKGVGRAAQETPDPGFVPEPTWLCPLHPDSHQHHTELQWLLVAFPAFLCPAPASGDYSQVGDWSHPRWA